LPLGLYLKTDVTGRDPSKWSVDAWLYDNVLYNSTDAFRAAVMQPGFKSLGANVEGLWAELEKQGDTPQFDESPPPAQVMSGSNRFSVDTEAQFVSWSKSVVSNVGRLPRALLTEKLGSGLQLLYRGQSQHWCQTFRRQVQGEKNFV
jgi:hypothetical protein